LVELNSIDLSLGKRLADPEFRREWFRAELEARVPELFRELRERRGMTQAELATKADMKQSAISRFELSTEATWKLETLLRLADALDAKLSISLEPAESVVARSSGEPKGGDGPPPRNPASTAPATS
jgi:HTH-type transcriptional regulator/antitoxin HipB